MEIEAKGRILAAALLVSLAAGCAAKVASPGRGGSLPGFPLLGGRPVALLPLENRSGVPVPLDDVQRRLEEALRARGIPTVGEDVVDAVLARHRIRWTGGASAAAASAFRDDAGVAGVLIGSVDAYGDRGDRQFALTLRLVSADQEARVLWMDRAAFRASEFYGFLGDRRVNDVRTLRDRAIAKVAGSLAGGSDRPGRRKGRGVILPKSVYTSDNAWPRLDRKPRVAVLPFINRTTTRDAGEIVTGQLLGAMLSSEAVEVIEPGEIRRGLLQTRMIQTGGLSIDQARVLRAVLDVDIVLTGIVSDYADDGNRAGVPFVSLSIWAIDTRRGQVMATATSYRDGDKGVFFFGAGQIHTAHELSARMARGIVESLLSLR